MLHDDWQQEVRQVLTATANEHAFQTNRVFTLADWCGPGCSWQPSRSARDLYHFVRDEHAEHVATEQANALTSLIRGKQTELLHEVGERIDRAIHSVDELRALTALIRDKQTELLHEVGERIDRAIRSVDELRKELEWDSKRRARLTAKIDGLAVARSYIDETIKIRLHQSKGTD